MLGLAFASLLAVVTPDPVVVRVGQTVVVKADFSPFSFHNGAGFHAKDPAVAAVSGWITSGDSAGTATVRGLREGNSQLMLTFAGGFSVNQWVIADIIVKPRCVPPTVTLDQRHARIPAGATLTVSAMTTGTPIVQVEWYDDGQRLRGAGSPFVLSGLAPGVHRITARARTSAEARSAKSC